MLKLKRIFGAFLAVSMFTALVPVSQAEELSVRIDGIGISGETLTAVVSGAPEDEEITYQWYYGPNGTTDKLGRTRAIEGANSQEWTVSLEECINVSYTEGKFSDYPVWVVATCGEQSAEAGTSIAPGRNNFSVYNASVDTGTENVFAVAGKEFIVLDNDESEMFILTKEDYGTHKLDNSNSLRYSTERETNIGYWLNNDFLEAGNGGAGLPEGIKPYINEHTWVTNNIVSDAENGIETTEDTAKLALMSVEEFNKYSGRYGIVDSVPYRWWLRSSPNGTQGLCVDIAMVNKGSIGVNTRYDMASMLSVRPVFYLDKTIFANTKIDVYTAGTEVKDIIKAAYPDYESLLSAGYTDDELAALGYEVEGAVDYGELESVRIVGEPVLGAEWTIEYEPSAIPLEDLEIKWLYGPGKYTDSRQKEIPNTNGNKWTTNYDDLKAAQGAIGDYYIYAVVTYRGTTLTDVSDFAPMRNDYAVDGAVLTAPEENIFKVKGSDKEFILLDTTDSGYFVLAKDGCGTHKFNTENKVEYNPENENSIANWLNDSENGFLAQEDNLPETIINAIDYEHTWKTEAVVDNDIAYLDTTQGLSLLSLNEYNTYRKKIGTNDTGSRWWLRSYTGASQVLTITADGYGATLRCNPNAEYTVRPAFWLKNDFFSTVKLDVNSIGDNIKSILAENADALNGLYQSDEIAEIMSSGRVKLRSAVFFNAQSEVINQVESGTVTVNAEIENTKTEPKNAVIILVLYNNGLPIKIVQKDLLLEAKSNCSYDAQIEVDTVEGGYELAAYVWDGIDTMKPLGDALRIYAPENLPFV